MNSENIKNWCENIYKDTCKQIDEMLKKEGLHAFEYEEEFLDTENGSELDGSAILDLIASNIPQKYDLYVYTDDEIKEAFKHLNEHKLESLEKSRDFYAGKAEKLNREISELKETLKNDSENR